MNQDEHIMNHDDHTMKVKCCASLGIPIVVGVPDFLHALPAIVTACDGNLIHSPQGHSRMTTLRHSTRVRRVLSCSGDTSIKWTPLQPRGLQTIKHTDTFECTLYGRSLANLFTEALGQLRSLHWRRMPSGKITCLLRIADLSKSSVNS